MQDWGIPSCMNCQLFHFYIHYITIYLKIDFYIHISGVTNDPGLLDLSTRLTGADFCAAIKSVDNDYCFPELLTNSFLNRDISEERTSVEGCLCLEEVARDLRNPLILKSPPDGSGRLFIGEQIGLVHIFLKNKTKLPEPFLDISNNIPTSNQSVDERGLLGMAFHPKYRYNHKFYVFYMTLFGNDGQQRVRISEFSTSAQNPNRADHLSERKLLEVRQPFWNHNGGDVGVRCNHGNRSYIIPHKE